MYRHMIFPVLLITLLGCAPGQTAVERAVPGRVFATDSRSAVDCRLDRLATPWQDARLRGIEFRAVGNEPGWLMEIDAREIFLALDYGERQLRFPRPQPVREADAEVIVYRVEAGGQKLQVRIAGDPCQDSMADQVYPASVTVTLADRQYFGCGRKLVAEAP